MYGQTEFTGLTDEQVISRRLRHGSNSVLKGSPHQFWTVLRGIITEPLFIILVFAAIIYFIIGEVSEGMIMLAALIFVSGISFYQEGRSRNAVNALKKLASPRAKVLRNDSILEIYSEEIVVDDIIIVEDGNVIPADAIILKLNDFSVNESILTGESLPVLKDLAAPSNQIFQGTLVLSGSCMARVINVGAATQLGKIGRSLEEIETSKTPLQLQIRKFVRSMVIAGSIAFFIVWAINYYKSKDILNGLLQGLTLIMSVLPEEIPVAFSTFMALGAYHLYKSRVIAKSPYTVETLGAATVICVDKTGTITKNEMKISAIYDFEKNIVYDYTAGNLNFNIVLEHAMWSSETEPFDCMEKAIHEAYGKTASPDRRSEFSLTHEYPLAGLPPFMTHVFSNKNSEHIIACKGGVESVLRQCRLSVDQITLVKNKAVGLASRGYRVLGVGKSMCPLRDLPQTQFEFEFEFLGLIAFYDPPKNNIPETLKKFYDAGINVKMITGDYSETALAIAKQIGMKNSVDLLTGKDVIDMDEETLLEKVEQVNVFARMFPDAKLRVIEALKKNNEVVAMTGDGVNDGPALKSAHIGIAMGLRGSEVAKSAASLILMDDDLSGMTDAVALGRRIYENLKKAIQYIISIHIPIILIVTLPLLFLWKFTDIFSPIHVIFLELIMGPTCSVIFENEPIEADSMKRKPRKMTTTFFSWGELSLSIVQGLVITAACLGIGYYFIQKNAGEEVVRTMIYSTLIFSNLFLTLVNRSFYYSIFTTIRYKNRLIPLILSISLVVLLLSIYSVPVQRLFHFTGLSAVQLITSFLVAFTGVIWMEFYKLRVRRK